MRQTEFFKSYWNLVIEILVKWKLGIQSQQILRCQNSSRLTESNVEASKRKQRTTEINKRKIIEIGISTADTLV